jgi:hypothetical protein
MRACDELDASRDRNTATDCYSFRSVKEAVDADERSVPERAFARAKQGGVKDRYAGADFYTEPSQDRSSGGYGRNGGGLYRLSQPENETVERGRAELKFLHGRTIERPTPELSRAAKWRRLE